MRKSVIARAGVVGLTAGLLVPAGIAGAAPSSAGGMGHLDAGQAASLAAGTTQPVIIRFKAQVAGLDATATQSSARKAAVARVQAPVVNELHQIKAANLRSYSLINAVSAKVSPAEESRLASDPAVASVVPDQTAHLNFTVPPVATAARAASNASSTPNSSCQVGKGGTELDPEALQAIHANSNLPGTGPTAASLGVTGAGVKVAFIAEGFQPDQPNFIRADGAKVVVDEKDFTGEGIGNSSGGEASLDASSIAAQGNVKYTVPLTNGTRCTFTILGAAPGASVVGLKVFSDNYLATTSSILQAIEYAVTTDHVNVLNESFGYDPLPDTMTDVVRQADEAAVAAGTVVSVSTGDAGPTSTQGSPSTDPAVLAAGASTTYRVYAQESIAAPGVPFKGWENDNLSALSSGGFTEGGKGPNLIAPGDLNWVSSNPSAGAYAASISGGTSEAAPLTSAVAALVIQAYRKTHGGQSPTVALVKQIITSTTTDVGLPADQQGTGLLNAYRAVLAAEAVKTSAGAPKATGTTLLTSTNDITATAAASTAVTKQISITNTGSATQTVSGHGRILSAPHTLATASIANSGSIVQKKLTFTVAPGTAYLAAHAATTSTPLGQSVLDVDLIDPLGRLANDGLPEGNTLASNVGVRQPAAGTWTAYVTYQGAAAPSAPIAFNATGQTWLGFGTVTPAHRTLAPGDTGTFTLKGKTPARPGDESAAVEFTPSHGQPLSIPIALRSLVTLRGGSGSFSTAVFGGNGRAGAPSSAKYFQIDVPAGAPELNVSTRFTNGPASTYTLLLISPSGEALGHASNQLMVGGTTTAPVTTTEAGAASHVLKPASGRWTIIVAVANVPSGTAVSSPLTGTVDLAPSAVTAKGLPTSGSVPVGSSNTAAVTVHNTTNAPQAYFLDARLNKTSERTLVPYASTASVTLPLADSAAVPQWIVPTNTTSLQAQVDATAVVSFDMSPYLGSFGGELNGDPQVSGSRGTSATATYSDNPVTPGDWNVDPALVGVFGRQGAAAAQAKLTLKATTLDFDPAASTAYGDLWTGDTALHPVIVGPGRSTTLYAVINPGQSGSVTGTLFVDTASEISPYGNAIPAGDQVAALPYHYTATAN
jgi:Subtilase family/Peptidase inhibitor I9